MSSACSRLPTHLRISVVLSCAQHDQWISTDSYRSTQDQSCPEIDLFFGKFLDTTPLDMRDFWKIVFDLSYESFWDVRRHILTQKNDQFEIIAPLYKFLLPFKIVTFFLTHPVCVFGINILNSAGARWSEVTDWILRLAKVALKFDFRPSLTCDCNMSTVLHNSDFKICLSLNDFLLYCENMPI